MIFTFLIVLCLFLFFFFFFQAEDGIRDYKVTGVQTCALPIWYLYKGGVGAESPRKAAGLLPCFRLTGGARKQAPADLDADVLVEARFGGPRSEERRVGKECRCGRGP